jgi:hypothetical protein
MVFTAILSNRGKLNAAKEEPPTNATAPVAQVETLTRSGADKAVPAALLGRESPPVDRKVEKPVGPVDGASGNTKPSTRIAGPVAAARADDSPSTSTKSGSGNTASVGATTTPATPDAASLEAIGTLAAAHYFQTYLLLGFVADAKANGNYAGEDARKVLQSILSVIDSVDRQLDSLAKRPMAKEDRSSLEQMRAISVMLRRQGKDLQTCWESGQEEDRTRYESERKVLYSAISKLMGIGPQT